MRGTILLCLVALCTASAENLSGREAGGSFVVHADVHVPSEEYADAATKEKFYSESVRQLDLGVGKGVQDEFAMEGVQESRALVRRVSDTREESETTSITDLSRDVRARENSGPDPESVRRMMEILKNIDEEFSKQKEIVNNAQDNMKRLTARVEDLENFRQIANIKKKKDKNKLEEMEYECALMFNHVDGLVKDTESKISDFSKTVHSRSSRSEMSELIYRAEYERLKSKVKTIKGNLERAGNSIGRLFIKSKNDAAMSKSSMMKKVTFKENLSSSN